MARKTILFVFLTAALAAFALKVRVRAQTGAPALPVDESARTILIRWGLRDSAEKSWRGSLEAEGSGQVLEIRGYHFQADDRVEGANAWRFRTRRWMPHFLEVDLSPGLHGPRAIFPNGIFAIVRGTRFRLASNGESYALALNELAGGKAASFDGGNVQAELVPVEMAVSQGPDSDFPALAQGPRGRLAAAWMRYSKEEGRDRVVCRVFDGRLWLPAEEFEFDETRDVFRPAAAYDGAGALHVIWAAQVNGDWDLYERRRTAQGWQPVERLTRDAGTDFNPRVVADGNGDLWLAWQGFRNGQSDIFLKRYTGGKWDAAMRISESPANDWQPALAAGPAGTVWVGWDTYDRGNYDVMVRRVRNGALEPARAITRSARFHANVSLAADGQGRLWAAFDEADANWGKDYGYLVKDRGVPLYLSRRIRLVRLNGETVEEPEAPMAQAFPLWQPEFLQYPQLYAAPDGQVAMVAMTLDHADRVAEVWGERAVWTEVALALDGRGWRRAQVLAESAGEHEMRAAVAGGPGGIWAAWTTDYRTYDAGLPRSYSIHAARIFAPEAAGEIRMKPFLEEPDPSPPSDPAEKGNVETVRRYAIRSGGKEYHILRGDLHRHTGLSHDGAGDGSLWDYYRYMLDAASMDYTAVTDHQGGEGAYPWWKIQKSNDLFQQAGKLTTFYAYERSIPYPNGHRNILFPKRGAEVLDKDPAEVRGERRSGELLFPYLRKWSAVALPHTSATDMGTDWADHSNELEPLVEVYQGDRNAYEHEGGPRGASASRKYMQRGGYQPAGFIWNALAKGYRMGFEASSDHCSTHISYACILAESNSREAILNAIRLRRAYGATDNIVMDFRVSAGGREYLQGDEIRASGPFHLKVEVIGTAPIRRIDVIHNERYVYAVTPRRTSVRFVYTDPAPAAGGNRYYVRMEQVDGNLAWSSPVWVTR